ncbi:hypothetical protein [Gordonia paraffinivorans]|uniref:hypothetical protein n=1 Tax=Gordonia paraffinivorans TaxID=175628 RepID=UPI003FCC7F22
MPVITRIEYKRDRDKHWIYVDGEYCCSIRGRTFSAMDLEVGQERSCTEIQDMEQYFWKRSYGESSWQAEKVRSDRIIELIEDSDRRLEVVVTGFGADTNEFIAEHPSEAGAPDLQVRARGEDRVLALVEVTGTTRFRGGNPPTYWVRPDKLEYARNHPDSDVWIVLHYAEPSEQIVAIRPDNTRAYDVSEVPIRGATEHFVIFSSDEPECVNFDALLDHLRSKL